MLLCNNVTKNQQEFYLAIGQTLDKLLFIMDYH